MPKAEVGSTKHVANKMKAKGLQRLRWYCQICEKQCRDENGFKQHTQSEGHVRALLHVGEDPRKFINDYSRKFQQDFVQLLKSTKNEKKVHMNNFYQEYIRDKDHVHMNATKWPSLTEFAKHLGREGICRIEEDERGLEIQWIDDSAEAVRRKEDIAKKEKQAKGEEDLESRLLEQQVKRAKAAAERAGKIDQPPPPPQESVEAVAFEPIKVSLSLKGKGPAKPLADAQAPNAPVAIDTFSFADKPSEPPTEGVDKEANDEDGETMAAPPKISMSFGAKPKPANPLAAKNPFAAKKRAFAAQPEKKMSNTERMMKEELERKRVADERSRGGSKRPRYE